MTKYKEPETWIWGRLREKSGKKVLNLKSI